MQPRATSPVMPIRRRPAWRGVLRRDLPGGWALAVATTFALGLVLTTCTTPAAGQGNDSPPGAPADSQLRASLVPHSDDSRLWLSGQVNLVTQMHPALFSPYQGERSFAPQAEVRTSRVMTLYTGYRLTRDLSIIADLEMSGGRGIGGATGLAGYTNLDVVRAAAVSGAPYVARMLLHYTWSLSDRHEEQAPGPLALSARVAERRLEIRAGKFSLADFFDLNAVGSDSHLQFLNWAIDNDPAWDYAADVRGYTIAAMAEYRQRGWAVRFAEALMPTRANGSHLQGDVRRGHAENVEIERRFRAGGRDVTLRVLGFANHANLGSYREAIDTFRAGGAARPDVTAHALQVRGKHGVSVNADVAIASAIRAAYGRAGWNDGRNESFAYTEADRAVSGGFDVGGARWGRPSDKLGLAVSVEGLSSPHREYLSLGGLGFILGDGALRYRRERVLEAYYTMQLWHGLFLAADLQHIVNPGYNGDRGPLLAAAARMHVEF